MKSPGRVPGAFPCRWNPVPAKNVANGLIRKFLSKIGKGSHDPVITPTRILFRHADYQLTELWSDPRPPGIGAVFRPIKLLRDQSSVPPQNRVWFPHARYLLQRLAAEPFPDIRRRGSLRIGQPKSLGSCARRMRFCAVKYSSAIAAVGLPAQSRKPEVAPTRSSSCRLSIIAKFNVLEGFGYYFGYARTRQPRRVMWSVNPSMIRVEPNLEWSQYPRRSGSVSVFLKENFLSGRERKE
jgi:hypothetical protein